MTPAEHYTEAERLLTEAEPLPAEMSARAHRLINLAYGHATLACCPPIYTGLNPEPAGVAVDVPGQVTITVTAGMTEHDLLAAVRAHTHLEPTP